MLRQRWGRPATVAAVAFVLVLAGLLLATLGADDDGDARADGGTATAADADRSTNPPPEVLGDVAERTPSTASTTTPPPSSVAAPTTTTRPTVPAPTAVPPARRAPAGPTSTAPASPSSTAPTTTTPTTTTCRNSTDPACGELVWQPAPTAGDVAVEVLAAPERATVGEETTFAVGYVDRAGPEAFGACTRTDTSAPEAPSVEDCGPIENVTCERHGPHDPPPPASEPIPVGRTFTFTTPGTHTVTLSGITASHLGDGCPSPYQQRWSRTFSITVQQAGTG